MKLDSSSAEAIGTGGGREVCSGTLGHRQMENIHGGAAKSPGLHSNRPGHRQMKVTAKRVESQRGGREKQGDRGTGKGD